MMPESRQIINECSNYSFMSVLDSPNCDMELFTGDQRRVDGRKRPE